jgi:hypothetical protein
MAVGFAFAHAELSLAEVEHRGSRCFQMQSACFDLAEVADQLSGQASPRAEHRRQLSQQMRV